MRCRFFIGFQICEYIRAKIRLKTELKTELKPDKDHSNTFELTIKL